MTDRRAELAANLHALRARIAAAADAAARNPADITVIAVTKTWPASDIRYLHELGMHDFAENRDQEAASKAAELVELDLAWHFVGQLQTNKAAHVASYADYVHTVDRSRLVTALAKGAQAAGRRLHCLIQVSLDPDAPPERGGAQPGQLPELAAAVASSEHLELAGLMAVAPLNADPEAAFAELARLRSGLLAEFPTATMLSAGMSEDLEAAVRHGATHLRIGGALLGNRQYVG